MEIMIITYKSHLEYHPVSAHRIIYLAEQLNINLEIPYIVIYRPFCRSRMHPSFEFIHLLQQLSLSQ